MSLIVEGLSKRYGNILAVENLSFICKKGSILGLLGRNGSGKTTTIRMILNIVKKDLGKVSWEGRNIDCMLSKIGYLPEERGLYQKLTIEDQLTYFAKLKGMRDKDIKKNIEYYLDLFKLSDVLNRKAETLSKGNQQKIQIISVLVHEPELIIFDEPFSGLDPVNMETLSEVIKLLHQKGRTILISSHLMNHVERFCENIVLMKEGRVLLNGDLNKIKKQYRGKKLQIKTNNDIACILERFKINYNVVSPLSYEIEIYDKDILRQFLLDLNNNEIEIYRYNLEEPCLNDIFLKVAGDDYA